MRRIIVSMNMTVDGFIAAPNGGLDWQFNNWTSDMAIHLARQLNAADTILLGRNTYDAMAAYWPFAGCNLGLSRDDIAYATLMNSYPKIVCSNTLDTPAWHNTHIFKTDIYNRIHQLKQQAGKDIIIYGSRKLVQSLAQRQLINEYHLWVYPVSLGSGIKLFNKKTPLQLVDSFTFPSGVLLTHYRHK